MSESVLELTEKKRLMREEAHSRRNAQTDKDGISKKILEQFFSLPAFQQAATVLFYLDVRSEVRTRHSLEEALQSGKRILVPYCVEGELELFHLENMDELEVGMYRILEPKAELRNIPAKKIPVTEIDVIMVPGVAFDRHGGRMGHGKGYYDKLLEHARMETPLIALAFECQLFDEIPMQQHDIYMDIVITEAGCYQGRGRKS